MNKPDREETPYNSMTAHNAAKPSTLGPLPGAAAPLDSKVLAWGTQGNWYVFSSLNGGLFLTRYLAWTPHFAPDCFFSCWEEADKASKVVADMEKREQRER